MRSFKPTVKASLQSNVHKDLWSTQESKNKLYWIYMHNTSGSNTSLRSQQWKRCVCANSNKNGNRGWNSLCFHAFVKECLEVNKETSPKWFLSRTNIGSKKAIEVRRRLGQQSGRLLFSVLEKNYVNKESILYLVPVRYVSCLLRYSWLNKRHAMHAKAMMFKTFIPRRLEYKQTNWFVK